MGLFRPYEQGKTEQAGSQDEQPKRSGASRAGATAATAVKATPAAVAEQPAKQDAQPARRSRLRLAPRRQGGSSAAPRPDEAATTSTATVSSSVAPDVDAAAGRKPKARQPQKKGVPTPTRAEAEAARMARLHPTLSPKEQKRAQREADREARSRNLSTTENQPTRLLARDVVDSRWSLSEFTMPIMFVVLIAALVFPRVAGVQLVTMPLMMLVVLAWVVDAFINWRRYKRLAAERGLDARQRGMGMYVVNRTISMRALRQPKPRVGRGEQI